MKAVFVTYIIDNLCCSLSEINQRRWRWRLFSSLTAVYTYQDAIC